MADLEVEKETEHHCGFMAELEGKQEAPGNWAKKECKIHKTTSRPIFENRELCEVHRHAPYPY